MTAIKEFFLTKLPEYVGGPDVKIDGLKKLSILFGKNGSGKSLYLRRIAEQSKGKTHYCNPEKAGNFAYSTDFFESELNAETRFNNRRENLNPNYYQQVVTRIQSFLTKRGAWTNGIAPVSHLDIESLLQTLLPDYDITIQTEKPYVQVKSNGGTQIDLNRLSSGERHILGLGLDIASMCAIWKLEKSEETILLIDEPDAHLHPDLHQNFALFVRSILDTFSVQILISTHSSTLLAALGHYLGEDASVVYLKKGGQTQTALPLSNIQKELASILGGHALMGPLFGVPLLLVEGDDDYKIWSQVPRHHKFSFAVIPCNGDEIYRYQKALEMIFASMLSATSSNSGYALLDADKSLPNPKNVPQNHIKFIRLACHESENLYLTDAVLSKIGTNWAQAKESILEKKDRFGNKQPTLQRLTDWDRKNTEVKNIINELASILDQKNVHWTTRVGQTIGAGNLSDELKDFLGADVIKAVLNLK